MTGAREQLVMALGEAEALGRQLRAKDPAERDQAAQAWAAERRGQIEARAMEAARGLVDREREFLREWLAARGWGQAAAGVAARIGGDAE